MNLAVVAPVWQALLNDDRLDVRFTGPRTAVLQSAFESAGVAHRVVSRSEARVQRWDLYINADPWEPATLWRCRRRLNFFHGVAGKFDLDRPVDLPLEFHRYDRVAFPNEGRLSNYVEAGLVSPERASLVGFPKLDALVNARVDRRAAARALGLSDERATAIYAPTFSPESSLQKHGEAIVNALLASGLNVMVKLHDRSLDPDPRYSGGHDWRACFRARTRPGQFLFAEGGDSTPYLLAADMMVTDHSTIGFEFCALDRPLIVFDAPELIAAARINPEKAALLQSAADVVAHPAEIPAAVEKILADPHRGSAARMKAVKAVFHDPGGATARALALCYELLECPAHAVDPRRTAAAGA